MQTVKEIIEVAILRENDCYRFFSEKASDESDALLSKFFSEQAEEDLEHCEKLRTMITDKIDKYDNSALDQIRKDPFLEPLIFSREDNLVDILKSVALKKQEAATFYNKMADIAPSQDLQNKYHNLANIELALKNRVAGKADEIAKMN